MYGMCTIHLMYVCMNITLLIPPPFPLPLALPFRYLSLPSPALAFPGPAPHSHIVKYPLYVRRHPPTGNKRSTWRTLGAR